MEDDIKEQSKRCHFNNSILGGETSKQGICFLKQQDIKHGGGVLKEKKQTKVVDCQNDNNILECRKQRSNFDIEYHCK